MTNSANKVKRAETLKELVATIERVFEAHSRRYKKAAEAEKKGNA